MEHVFTTGQDLDFIDLSLKKDGVVIDWLEFTLFQRRPVGLRGLSDQARREVFGAFGLAESARKWQERYDSVFDRCKTADSIRWVMKRHLEKGKDVLMMAAAYQWKTFSVEEVLQLLPSHMACGLEKLPGGIHGYRSRYATSAGLQIWADGTAGMGIHVTISGGTVQGFKYLRRFVKELLYEGARFTRIDVAIDEHRGKLSVEKMIRKAKKGECSSRLRRYSVVEGGFISDGSSTGKTLYLGKRGSDFMTRIYDKRLQMIYEKNYPQKLLPKSWVRVEMELRDVAAQNAAIQLSIFADYQLLAHEILNNYVEFKDRSKDKNKSRWPMVSWWSDFIGSIPKMSVSRVLQPSTVERRVKWFTRQCAPSLAILMETHGQEAMLNIWKSGNTRITEDQREQINVYHRKKRRPELQGRLLRILRSRVSNLKNTERGLP